MHFESSANDFQRLLPKSVEDRLLGVVGRATGVVLAVIVAAAWLSLLTWTLADPSLTHATGGSVSNLLGGAGAIFSDLLLQTLGIATVAALLPPMFWSFELAMRERVADFRIKLCLYPAAVLALAAGCSALPVASRWPLHHGYGGILGDVVFNLAAGVLSAVNPDRAGAAAGLVLFACGLAALTHSLGLSAADLGRMMPRRDRLPGLRALPATADTRGWQAPANIAPRRGWLDRFGSIRRTDKYQGGLEPGFAPGDRDLGPPPSWPEYSRHDEPALQAPDRLVERRPVAAPPAQASVADEERFAARHDGRDADPRLGAATARNVAPADPSAYGPTRDRHDPGPVRRGARFDASTDAESRAMAARFSPHAADPAAASRRPNGFLSGLALRRPGPVYRRPSLNLLKRPGGPRPGPEFTQTMLRGNARLLEDVLADFGVKSEIKDIRPGPVVTLYEVEPARGTKSARVIGLADDIARSMSVAAVRVAVVPGRNAIGIELPNVRRETVGLREILEAEAFRSSEPALPLALGKSIAGEPVVVDLARMPHLLVAGTTGSGKSVGVNAMILSLLYRYSPQDCRFLMIDPKMLELSVYNGIPHLLTPVVTDPHKALAALNWVVAEMEERYKRMAQLGVRNIDVYNNRVRNARKRGEALARAVQTGFDPNTGEAIYEREELGGDPLPFIVVVVDEFADLMIVAGKEIEAAVQRLAQMARAAGIHLIMATQRPSVDIVTGTIKANFPSRIGFKVASKIDSRTILNETGAEQLLGQGDMLLSNGTQLMRVHGAFVADEEVEAVVAALREQGEPAYVDGIAEPRPQQTAEPEARGGDDLYDKAVAIVLRDRKASTSYLQRRLGIGYNRAADLIERMEREGLVGAANGVGKREIRSPDIDPDHDPDRD